MVWLESLLGRYPFDTYGSLIIDGDLGFALETQTLSLYDTGFIGRADHVVRPVMAHELAHQWFGNRVAPWEWSDVWQNEGHATWYELQYSLKIGTFPKYTGSPTLDAHFRRVYARGDQDRASYGPVARPLRAGSIWDVFNPNVYDGGALVLYALRQRIGTATFQELERAWVAKHRGRSAGTDDFIALAGRVSGEDLRSFLRAWLYGATTPPMPGRPDWTVTPATAPAVVATSGRGRAFR
jgi:aminopeptidase N